MRSSLFSRHAAVAAVSAALFLASTAAASTITLEEQGYSTLGTFLHVSATLSTQTTADPLENPIGPGEHHFLKVVLRSFGAPTVGKADVLSSFYFNLADPVVPNFRPNDLQLVSGSGLAYQVNKNAADQRYSWDVSTRQWTANSSTASTLVATNDGDEGWQFKSQDPPQQYPSLGFGIGTVGNSGITSLVPTGFSFDGDVVRGDVPGDMINLGIYSDGTDGSGAPVDLNPDGGLTGRRLIRSEATFMFYTAGFDLRAVEDESWVQGNVTWGFGTNPETVFLPEPGTLPMLATAGAVALGMAGVRRTRGRRRIAADAGACDPTGSSGAVDGRASRGRR